MDNSSEHATPTTAALRIGGYVPCSLSDFPGRIAAVVFTQGCNWRCPWCHNAALVYPEQFTPPIPVVEACEEGRDVGILAHTARSDTLTHGGMLSMGSSYNRQAAFCNSLFLKMEGRKLYKYAVKTVAGAMKECLEKAGLPVERLTKILLHQANGKMDEAILRAFYAEYGIPEPPPGILPMTIAWLGNSSVATIPTMLDLIVKGKLDGHQQRSGDVFLFASVGAGMNINAFAYRVP